MPAASPADTRPVDLYHLAPSHYCEKARRILEYKKIPFRLVNVPYGNHDEVIRVSGQDYVPLIHTPDGTNITWSDIPDWAEAVAPSPTLYPNGRAVARLLDHWMHNVIEESVWQVVVPAMSKTMADPHEAWVFEEMQTRKRGPLAVVALRRDELLGSLRKQLELVEESLRSTPYILSDTPSLADFALYGALRPLEMVGEAIPAQLPQLRAWYPRIATV